MNIRAVSSMSFYIELLDFPKSIRRCIYKTVQARNDDKHLVNLDYDKKGRLIGIEILQHQEG